MAKHRTRVGIHARNSVHFTDHDYQLVRQARIETMKMMSQTDTSVYRRLREVNPDIEFIVRLYDDRLRNDSRPSPADFVAKMVPIINRLRPYVTKFEIHNEPNHVEGIEAWGSSDQHARSFRSWYLQVLPALKEACSWASFGFPGLALNYPHRDLEWLDICRDVILASDWLGCHCYWQYRNMMKAQWGLRFKLYHERFPNMKIEITEFGDSTPNRRREEIAEQYTEYYAELNKYPYLGSASAFIASSPDPTWSPFVWMKEGGEMLPVVRAVGSMTRSWVQVPTWPEPKPEEPPTEPLPPAEPRKRTFAQTGKTVQGIFLDFFEDHGLDLCGYPITDQITEAGVPAQYFQRLALEEFKSGKLRLKLVGTEAWTSRDKIKRLEDRVEELSKHPPSAGGVVKPPIEDIVEDLPTHATNHYATRSMSDISLVVIHHTATSPTITPQRIAKYQVRNLNKAGISYHFFIAADGVIYQTNRLETVSDHAFRRNQEGVGVCFAGNFGSAIPTTAQLEAGGRLCAWLLGQLHLSSDKIVGVKEFVNTASPGRQWLAGERWKDKLLSEVEAAFQVGGEDQSILIASLQEQIERLQEEIRRLEEETPGEGEPSATLLRGTVDRLTDLVVNMQTQTHTLQGEIARLEAALRTQGEDQSELVESLQQRIKKLQEEKQNLQEEMEAALKAKGDEQSQMIASLQARIKALQDELDQLKELPPPQPPPDVVPPGPHKVSKPPIQNLINTLQRHRTKRYGTRSGDDIQTLVIHHSAVPPSVGPKRIADYHVKNLDWPGMGYHFVVAEDGIIYQGNAITTVSFHAAKVNPRGVGICFLGNFNKKVPPAAQLQAGAHLVAWLMQELNLDLETVKGHKEYMSTACPGNQWLKGQQWKQMLRQEIAKAQQGTVQPTPAAKPIYHYMLFWHHGDSWAERDWNNAQNYIAAFQPTVGFSAKDAAQAQYVTIVGGPLGVSKQVEDWLVSTGSMIDRIAGANEAATKQMLTTMVNQGKRFRSISD
jgi:N-acetyl-anhydromuramyl-L-alanine amidase AmpD